MNLGSNEASSTGSNTTGFVAEKMNTATGMATGVAKMAYGHAMGDQETLQTGKQEWEGTNK